jgi:ubiquitin-conjugating enzyme E2 O
LVLHEDELNIIDRSLHLGDVVKRRVEDMMSGIISNGIMKLAIEHTFTGQKLENVNSQHVRSAFDFSEGSLPNPPRTGPNSKDQYILFQNRWVGQIDEIAQNVTLRLSNHTLVEVDRPEFLELATSEGNAITYDSLFLSNYFVVGQRVVCAKSNLRRGKWILGEYNPDIEPQGLIVDVRTQSLTVNWLAQRHQGHGTPAMQLQLRPPTVLYPEVGQIVVLSGLSDPTSYQIGDRVKFLDREIETGTYGGQRVDRRDFGGYDGNVWMVVGTETFVDIDWQDGTTSKENPAKDLRMYLNIDEYEGWPVSLSPRT